MFPHIVIGGLALWAVYKASQASNHGVMTAERRAIYEAAMNRKPGLDPASLRQLAAEYDAQGLPEFAQRLNKRADLRSLPQAVQDARRAAIAKAFNSTDSSSVRLMSIACEEAGMYRTAMNLREYADGLDSQAVATALTPNMPVAGAPVDASTVSQGVGPDAAGTPTDSSGVQQSSTPDSAQATATPTTTDSTNTMIDSIAPMPAYPGGI